MPAPRLLGHFHTTGEHDYSHCVDFDESAFRRPGIRHSADDPLSLTGHFEVSTYSRGPLAMSYVCPPDPSRQILPWSNDVGVLQGYIDDLVVGGSTSIDIGAKWGTALLHQSLRPVVNDYVDDTVVAADFRGRPFRNDVEEVLKVMVIMSDGENTAQSVLDQDYRDGATGIWVDERADARDGDSQNDDYSTYRRVWNANLGRWQDEWYHHDISTGWYYQNETWYYEDGWRDEPDGGFDRSYEMTWPDLFDRVSVAWWSRYLRRETRGGSNLTGYYDAFGSIAGSEKDDRTSDICAEARGYGIVVYTISFEAPAAGRTTLRDCASSGAHYFDVDGIEITEAFRAIASQINQLRLTR